MEHPSPEPQTAQPSLLPLPSHGASGLGMVPSQSPSTDLQTSSQTSQPSQLPQPDPGAPVLGTQSSPPALPPLVSLFDNSTFSLQEIRTEPTPEPETTDQTDLTTDLQVNETTVSQSSIIRNRFIIFIRDACD